VKCYECEKEASVSIECGSGWLHVYLCKKCIDAKIKSSQERLDAQVKSSIDKMTKMRT
jgi:hypothetical protein